MGDCSMSFMNAQHAINTKLYLIRKNLKEMESLRTANHILFREAKQLAIQNNLSAVCVEQFRDVEDTL